MPILLCCQKLLGDISAVERAGGRGTWQNVCFVELSEVLVVPGSGCSTSYLSSSLSHFPKVEAFVRIKSDPVLTVLFPLWSCRS